MRCSRWLVLVLVWLAASEALAGDVGTYCPEGSLDSCLNDKCTCSELGTSIGDPINIADGNSVIRRVDLAIRGSAATLKLLRTFSSKDATWNSIADVSDVPRPFGKSPTNSSSLRWWHNFFTYVHDSSASSGTIVRTAQGRLIEYGQACVQAGGSAPCWLARFSQNTRVKERLYDNGWGASSKLGTRSSSRTARSTSTGRSSCACRAECRARCSSRTKCRTATGWWWPPSSTSHRGTQPGSS